REQAAPWARLYASIMTNGRLHTVTTISVGICEFSFAYTRTSATPFVTRDKAGAAEMPVRLRLFDKVEISDGAKHPILCSVQKNEGFYVKLDEALVREWLDRNNIPLPN